ncbi:MAG: hypothetical protein JSS90_06275 [Bacteroidetes bacterium]|jgi:hypothetical protein|nr:hypothetical protein [Bacteroidota bacterium]
MSKKKQLSEFELRKQALEKLQKEMKNPNDSSDDLKSCMGCIGKGIKWFFIIMAIGIIGAFIKDRLSQAEQEKYYEPDNSYDNESRQHEKNNSSPGIPTFRSNSNNNSSNADEKLLLNTTSDNDSVVNPDSLRKWRNQQKQIEELKKELKKQKENTMSREEIEDYIDQEIENRMD